MEHMIKLWKHSVPSDIKLDSNTSINASLFADDQTIFQSNEDGLQRAIYKPYQLCQHYNTKILIVKNKKRHFKGRNPLELKLSWITKHLNKSQTFATWTVIPHF